VKLGFSPADEEFRQELLAFLKDNTPPQLGRGRDWLGDDDDVDADGIMVIPKWARDWQAKLFDSGWMIPGYPPALGGRDCTPTQTLIYLEEMARHGIPRSLHFGGYAIVAPSLLEFGNDQQKAMVPAAIRGDTIWCIGMSEPNAGSDLAALSTRAIDDGDSFIVNGQKVWTSYAMLAAKCFCYVRTDPNVPKHKGISVLIIDVDSPGIEVRPLRHMSRRAEFAEVFFSDVVVPKENLVGELNDGWRITMGSLAHERGALWVEGVMAASRAIDDVVTLAQELGLDEDANVRRKVAELAMEVRSLRALGYKGFASFSQGSSAPEHSYMKVAVAEVRKRIYELAMDLQGEDGPITDPRYAASGARWQRSWMTGLASTIGGGTSEIQRNVIATRVLGLPRS